MVRDVSNTSNLDAITKMSAVMKELHHQNETLETNIIQNLQPQQQLEADI